VAWAVEKVGAKPWMNALCLPRALAAHAMLRRRGIASRLCLGVARDERQLMAHAWIEIGETKLVLDPAIARFTRLAEFGEVH
jgi:transglutaminase-like putative cysteine protease